MGYTKNKTEINAIKARRRASNLEARLELQRLGYLPKSRSTSTAPKRQPILAQPTLEEVEELELKIAMQDEKIDRILDAVRDLKKEPTPQTIAYPHIHHEPVCRTSERLAGDVTDIKVALGSLVGHNQSFPLGQILGTLQSNNQAPIVFPQQPQIPHVPQQPQIIHQQPAPPQIIQAPASEPPIINVHVPPQPAPPAPQIIHAPAPQQPQPVAPPQSEPMPTPPTQASPVTAQSPMQKMLAEMNARMDAMGKKLD